MKEERSTLEELSIILTEFLLAAIIGVFILVLGIEHNLPFVENPPHFLAIIAVATVSYAVSDITVSKIVEKIDEHRGESN